MIFFVCLDIYVSKSKVKMLDYPMAYIVAYLIAIDVKETSKLEVSDHLQFLL